jgi:hypothetical protein
VRYTPEPPPLGSGELGEYLLRELQRIAATLDHPEATQLHYGKEVANTASGATLTINWKAGQKQRVDLGAAATQLIFSPPDGVCNLMLRLVQDGAGSRVFTFPASVCWQGGTTPTWSTGANDMDVVAMYFDGSRYHATASLNSLEPATATSMARGALTLTGRAPTSTVA